MSEKEKRAKEAIQAALATCVSEPFGQAVLKDLLETRNLDELKATFKKWRPYTSRGDAFLPLFTLRSFSVGGPSVYCLLSIVFCLLVTAY
jgi:hypothetical protein